MCYLGVYITIEPSGNPFCPPFSAFAALNLLRGALRAAGSRRTSGRPASAEVRPGQEANVLRLFAHFETHHNNTGSGEVYHVSQKKIDPQKINISENQKGGYPYVVGGQAGPLEKVLKRSQPTFFVIYSALHQNQALSWTPFRTFDALNSAFAQSTTRVPLL